MTTQPFKLTLAEGLPLLRQAWIEGRLGIQIGANRCRYDYGKNCGCAIGVMLPQDLRSSLSDYEIGVTVDRLAQMGRIVCLDDERTDLRKLQRSHDDAVDRTGYTTAFINLMNDLFRAHGLEPVEA